MDTAELNNLVEVIGKIASVLAVSGVIGAALTPVISYIKTLLGLNEPGKVLLKRIIAAVTSVFGGSIAVYFLGQFVTTTLGSLAISSFLVFVGTMIFYQTYWKDSDAIKKIEGSY